MEIKSSKIRVKLNANKSKWILEVSRKLSNVTKQGLTIIEMFELLES